MQAGMHRWMNRPKAYCLGSPWHWHNKVMIEHMLNENTSQQQNNNNDRLTAFDLGQPG